jgi:hypothetical protein
MLRLKHKKYWNYVFDAWVVGFTVLVVWALNDAHSANGHIHGLVNKNKQLIVANQKLSERTDFKICTRINNINIIITDVLKRSKQNIPKLMYYKQHPDEMRDQIAQINHEIYRFRPRTCGTGVK